MCDHVVLVNEANEPLGIAPKSDIHGANTPLHRGFSVFLFRKTGEFLIQQRSGEKITWPNIWSNSCCGHPHLEEPIEKAARRRLQDELGIQDVQITMIEPNYRYRFEKDGIVENEICPIMVATSSQEPRINPREVQSYCWVNWQEFVSQATQHPTEYSPWAVEETHVLVQHPRFHQFLQENMFA